MNEEEHAKQLAYYREKQIHDEISALAHARRESKTKESQRGSQKVKLKGKPRECN
jgi:hypothetical protein